MARYGGKQKYIETPEKMWELYCAYEEQCKATPIEVEDYVGRDAKRVYRKRERPLTLEGFMNYVADQGVMQNMYHYFSNQDGRYADYIEICSRIKHVIRQDQIEGGMSGIYNASITQRLNSLVEKSEQKQIVEQPLFDTNDDSDEG